MSEEIKQYILKNGLVLGAIYVAIDIIKYVYGAELFVNNYVSFASLLLAAIFPVFYLLQYKKSHDGFIDFRSAFSICTGILIASGFILLVFNILLFNIIDPGFSSELLDVTINTAVVQLETFGISDEQISTAIEMMEAEANFSPMNMLKGFGFTIVGYTLFGLIVAAITKKNNMNL
jgi:hypothetical protein